MQCDKGWKIYLNYEVIGFPCGFDSQARLVSSQQ